MPSQEFSMRGLPSIPFGDFQFLPDLPGVYMVATTQRILYIGTSSVFKQRWKSHLMKRMDECAGSRIYWIVTPPAFASFLEALLIAYLNPLFNEKGGVDLGDLLPVPTRSKRGAYGEAKRSITYCLTNAAINLVDVVAEVEGVSRSAILERIIRQSLSSGGGGNG